MPIGNPARDFDNIVASVKEFQSIDQSELILVIDSPDCPEASALSKIFSHKENVTVLHSSCGNPGGARNLGKEHSIGEWISFIDSDDSIDFKNYYQLVVEGSLAGAELTLGRYQLIKEAEVILDSKENISEHCVAKCIARNPGIWRMSFKRNLIEDIDFPNLRMAEDQIFLARLRFWERDIWISDFLVYTYRRNIVGQLTRSQDAISDLLKAQEMTLGLLFREPLKSDGSRILAIVFINQLLTSVRHLGLRSFAPLQRTFKRESGTIRLLRISARLAFTMPEEILYKSKRLRKAGANL
jgi:glycosyltransferase involved in cell wall biosynthesis